MSYVNNNIFNPSNPTIFNKVCLNNNIQQRFTAADTPAQNGMSERVNRTFADADATIMGDAVLLWSLV